MPNTSFTQQALASDLSFRLRLKNALAKVAWQVIDEDPNTVSHVQRATFARSVNANLDGFTAQIAPSIVTRTSVFAFATSLSETTGNIVTASGDLDIEGQLATDWNDMAGIV